MASGRETKVETLLLDQKKKKNLKKIILSYEKKQCTVMSVVTRYKNRIFNITETV